MLYEDMSKEGFEASEAVNRIMALGYLLQHMEHNGTVPQPLMLDEVISAVNDTGAMIVRDAEAIGSFMCDLRGAGAA